MRFWVRNHNVSEFTCEVAQAYVTEEYERKVEYERMIAALERELSQFRFLCCKDRCEYRLQQRVAVAAL